MLFTLGFNAVFWAYYVLLVLTQNRAMKRGRTFEHQIATHSMSQNLPEKIEWAWEIVDVVKNEMKKFPDIEPLAIDFDQVFFC